MQEEHFCQKHQTKFYRNERVDATGQRKVWYSHKLLDGKGFCVEKVERAEVVHHDIQPRRKNNETGVHEMFACNAMNNAIALASSGKIELNQIGDYFNKIYDELIKTSK